ncbi:hypothetical protein ACIBI9_47870 [Nonomuraea sp. NPDC050451]|uniref:hypothetical protein n=1 Tax=Nonomuraea sp. NPDC050451 TaxID=3364364 RepID=UPI0037AC7E24
MRRRQGDAADPEPVPTPDDCTQGKGTKPLSAKALATKSKAAKALLDRELLAA